VDAKTVLANGTPEEVDAVRLVEIGDLVYGRPHSPLDGLA
jgi:hypothetical protein